MNLRLFNAIIVKKSRRVANIDLRKFLVVKLFTKWNWQLLKFCSFD